ncbi:ArsA-related P-loop ATPase [Parenemella sanctibonifatiensis]|uniref:ATPase n=1 Tax=Parenemella sanctibonifatiensis TaxID=2016505 RepID=A0A255DZ59_9ACTN|nr:ArsA-related P-loop ATPase [Parenemella sanctibonifatiensis]OYN84574.1 ATPase [Parenemella sanctibonifatiensis]OYN92654.1 ATPase [Parenemella sanctibonifatiensis]
MTSEPVPLHIVSGKGGTGKTTVAAAVAYALARDGARVLLCEVEGRQAIAEFFATSSLGDTEQRVLASVGGGRLVGQSVVATHALREYLTRVSRTPLAGQILDKVGLVDFAATIAPGLRDLLLLGMVYDAVQAKPKGRTPAYDAVVLDAPPTGRLTNFLDIHTAVADLARSGPIHSQARSIAEVMQRPQTRVHLVSLLADLPATETIEAAAELERIGVAVGAVITNRVLPADLVPDHLDRGTAPWQQQLAAEVGLVRDRHQHEQSALARLQAVDRPVVSVPELWTAIDHRNLPALADHVKEAIHV